MNEIFKAIYDRLTAQLTPVIVYDHVPQDLSDSGYPFIKLNPIDSDNNDTDTENGFDAVIDVIGYSRYRGIKELSDICDSVYDALHQYNMPNTASYGISIIYEETRRLVTAPDGLTRNSIQSFRIVFEPL